MPTKIQNRYPTLVRELALEGAPENFMLQPEVVGVVLLHEHCEGVYLGASATASGAVGPLQVVGVVFPRAGAYQVSLYWDSNVAVAAQEAAYFRLQDSSIVGNGGQLWYFNFGYTATERGTLVLPKIHVEERMEVVGYLATTMVAGNQLTMGIGVQPL